MIDVLRRIKSGDREDEPGVASQGTGRRRLSDRLSDTDICVIIAQFRDGVPKHRLATTYGMSLSTMKRLLRAHGAGQ